MLVGGRWGRKGVIHHVVVPRRRNIVTVKVIKRRGIFHCYLLKNFYDKGGLPLKKDTLPK